MVGAFVFVLVFAFPGKPEVYVDRFDHMWNCEDALKDFLISYKTDLRPYLSCQQET
jgi:hypothetical protein